MKVNLMIIGAQKCGTSTLFKILDTHPAIAGSKPKELNFFNLTKDWRRDLPSYEKHFEQGENKLYVEASPSYTFFPGAQSQSAFDQRYPIRRFHIWDDIYEYNPDTKFIYLVRDPVDRIVSSYVHHFNRRFTTLGIEEAVLKDRLFLDATRYFTQINPYVKKFGRENVLIIDFEEFIRDKKSVVESVSHFLGLDPNLYSDYESAHFNAASENEWIHHKLDRFEAHLSPLRKIAPSIYSKYVGRKTIPKPKLSADFEKMIRTLLEVEMRELGRLMGKDLSKWMLAY